MLVMFFWAILLTLRQHNHQPHNKEGSKTMSEEERQKLLDEIRPKGEWISREDMDYVDENKVVHNHFQCNKCGLIHDFVDGHTSQYNFCPNCGADMRK